MSRVDRTPAHSAGVAAPAAANLGPGSVLDSMTDAVAVLDSLVRNAVEHNDDDEPAVEVTASVDRSVDRVLAWTDCDDAGRIPHAFCPTGPELGR